MYQNAEPSEVSTEDLSLEEGPEILAGIADQYEGHPGEGMTSRLAAEFLHEGELRLA